ncbi:M15 family metallopeptidase [Agromyces sp. NPDC056379]|uniref:M15 family metallopeptidase n=1 Tax=unclassified Agromyces TaxID=2639701 RepID=UPI0035D71B2E
MTSQRTSNRSTTQQPRHRRRRRMLAAGIVFLTPIALLIGAVVGLQAISADGAPGDTPADALGVPDPDTGYGVDDGYIEEGESVSPFADDLPAIANLEPELRGAMQDAARAAIADGYEFVVTNGWRSAAYQQVLLNAAIAEYGSEEEARRYVAAPEASKHVTGEAVDIGRTDANSWLSQHGADYGLCQTYANEMWHFELATTPGGECPAQLSDASAG